MKILINTPDISLLGGVANHYKGLKAYWKEDVHYNYVGGRKGIPGPIILIFDYIKFFFLCLFGNFDVIVLNPSLGKTAVQRDTLFLKIAKLLGKKVVVFFHGWDNDYEKHINRQAARFVNNFNRTDLILILANEFKNKLINWGINVPIALTTTKVDNTLIENTNHHQNQETKKSLLFLARVEKEKGVYLAIDTYISIKEKYSDIELIIAGDGNELGKVKKYVTDRNIRGISFTGYIKGKELQSVFQKASIYFFPTFYGEGMPTSVLEAMAFGLPVITRPVGGLVDFFENDKMGWMIESLEAADYVESLTKLLSDSMKMKTIGKYNADYAKRQFMASEVAKSLEEIFKNVIKK